MTDRGRGGETERETGQAERGSGRAEPRAGQAERGSGRAEPRAGQAERETGQVEAFTAFLGGLLAAGLTVSALLGAGWVMTATAVAVPSEPWVPRAAKLLVAVVWPATTAGLYRRLRRGGRVRPGGRTR